jgi:hypothetical protein
VHGSSSDSWPLVIVGISPQLITSSFVAKLWRETSYTRQVAQ